jgi:hypothetical protein
VKKTSTRLIESRIVALKLFNALLFWLWRWLRSAYDAGFQHPDLVLSMMGLTLRGWWQLQIAITSHINNGPRH